MCSNTATRYSSKSIKCIGMGTNPLFPIFLKLESLHTLLVGGGNVGLEKLSAIVKNSPNARVTVIAPKIRNEVKALANGSSINFIERDFQFSDLDTADVVVLATDNPALHKTIREVTRSKRLLVNVADTPELCDFYLGAVVTKGNLKIGISTNGKSPTIAKRMREYLEEALPENIDELLTNMHSIRQRIKGGFTEKVNALNAITTEWLKSAK